MPIYSATQTAPAQFDGTTAAKGLFAPGGTGGASIQVRINSIAFSGASAITDWTLSVVDPLDGQETVLLTDTTTEFAAGGPSGFYILPTNFDSTAWQLKFVTTGMTGTGVLKIDHDAETTEG